MRARLTVAGAKPEEVEPYLLDPAGVDIVGPVAEDEKWRLLSEADVLCAPSLGGESFGMVLDGGVRGGNARRRSEIAGYRDVARDGVDSVLVPAGNPADLGEALHSLAVEPDAPRAAWRRRAPARRALRLAARRPRGDVRLRGGASVPEPEGAKQRMLVRAGLQPADGGPSLPPRKIPSIEPAVPTLAPRRKARTLRRVGVAAGAVLAIGLTALALNRIGLQPLVDALVAATPIWIVAGFALMCASMLVRAEAWHAVLKAALPGTRVRRRDTARATMIGVLMSATLPARLGEPSRALIMARRTGPVRDRLPVVLGTLVSQTLLNIVALVVLGSVMFATVGLFQGNEDKLVIATIIPIALIVGVLIVPALLRSGKPSRFARVQQAVTAARRAMVEVRRGLDVFRNPKLGAWAAFTQLLAWAIQWLACYLLLVALGLDHEAGLGAAAAVLFAVNVTAVLPATPSNVGVFQAACVAVLSAYGVGHTDAFAYGVILQAVEIATAVALGAPAMLAEGMSWKDLRLRALHAAPVELRAAAERRRKGEAEAQACRERGLSQVASA